jgi:hypothetical protein
VASRSGESRTGIKRIVAAFEAGRDGFWLARWLRSRRIEVYAIHAVSIPVPREHKRAKTDRLDLRRMHTSGNYFAERKSSCLQYTGVTHDEWGFESVRYTMHEPARKVLELPGFPRPQARAKAPQPLGDYESGRGMSGLSSPALSRSPRFRATD